MQIFIMYARRDRRFVERLIQLFDDNNLTYWTPETHVPPGDDVFSAVHEALKNSDVLLVVVTPESSRSEWMSSQLSVARALHVYSGKPVIIPILADKHADPPFFLQQFQWVDMSSESQFEASAKRLIDVLKAGSEHAASYDAIRLLQQLHAHRELLSSEKRQFDKATARKTWRTAVASTLLGVVTIVTTLSLLIIGDRAASGLVAGVFGFVAGVLATVIAWRVTHGK